MRSSFFSDHKTALLEVRVNLFDSFAKASISKVDVVLYGVVPVLFSRIAHNFIESGVDNVDFTGTTELPHVG